ncbi:MAG TPA: putative quinol monooxygenase [Vicinamibacterales bacterium]|nr:putative quinol monooxygenase [Vicinamibacterales bacterium]
MYIVTVEFDVESRFVAPFMEAMLENARISRLLEAGCRQFDVCTAEDDPTRVFLYEVYDDRAAFEAHLSMAHYKAFDASVQGWVTGKRVSFYRGAR